jgi:DNA-binding transcriptional ArsR family regulator
LRLVERLAEGRWCVSELAAAAVAPISTVSQQLRILRTEGIVVRERSGKHIYYTLADRHVRDLVANALAHADEPDHPSDSNHEEDPDEPSHARRS